MESYDFVEIYRKKSWHEVLVYPDNPKGVVDFGYQLIQFILDGPKQLYSLGMGYTSSNKFKDNITAFMRKSIEPYGWM